MARQLGRPLTSVRPESIDLALFVHPKVRRQFNGISNGQRLLRGFGMFVVIKKGRAICVISR